MGELPESLIKKVDLIDAWSEALDYKVDIHLVLMTTKDPVKRKRLQNLYAKAERVCDRLAKELVKYE